LERGLVRMEPSVEPIKEILDELFSLLETFETHSIAITQFLKDQGIATDEKLAPYLDRAGNTSSVKWRAARARMQYLLSPIQKEKKEPDGEKAAESGKKSTPEQAGSTEGSTAASKKSTERNEADKSAGETAEKPRAAAGEKASPPAKKP
jgi:hypothetical protein